MCPVVLAEAGNAPELTERLDGARGCRPAHVRRLPAERLDDLLHLALCSLIVSTIEHRRPPAVVVRVHHARVADAVERLDEAGLGVARLKLLEQRAVRP